MVYAIVKVVNDSYAIYAEGITDICQAKTNFHGLCQTLWNAPDVITACVMIVDTELCVVDGYKEYISHPIPPVQDVEA